MVFQKKPLEKADFIAKMTSQAMVQPASSDKIMESPLNFLCLLVLIIFELGLGDKGNWEFPRLKNFNLNFFYL